MSPFVIPLPTAWRAAPTDPPDVSATPQARRLSWDAYEDDASGRATVGCFGFDLGGYTDELAPIVLERTEPFAVRASGGARVVERLPWTRVGVERRQLLRLEEADGTPARALLAFAFADGELHSCLAVCRAPGDICTRALDEARFTESLTLPPPPTWPQALALSVLAHPRETAAGVVSIGVAMTLALLLTRGVRARFP